MYSNDVDFKNDLLSHKVYTAWQFIEFTRKNIETTRYCHNTIKSLIDKMTVKTSWWEQNLFSDFIETEENGKTLRKISVTTENIPDYEVRVAGEKVDPWFLFDKLLRDFYQYAMNTLDSISQIANAGLLANNEKKVDACDFQRMVCCFAKQTYSSAFPKTALWFADMNNSSEFKYIEAINNRTKHTADISNKLSMGILGSSNTAKIGPFFRKDVQHQEKNLSDQMDATIDFLNNSFDSFLNCFCDEFVLDKFVTNRRNGIDGVYQQKLKNAPDQDMSYAYISDSDFSAMPDEIYILLAKNKDGIFYSHECPFEHILVRKGEHEILGRYNAEGVVGDDCLLTFRKYVKDTSTPGPICMFYEQEGPTTFYHFNPYFNVSSVSDDNDFLTRTSIPF